jgi:hypothetical protein
MWEQNLHGFFKIEIEGRSRSWHSLPTGALMEAMLYGIGGSGAGGGRAAGSALESAAEGPAQGGIAGETLGRMFGNQGHVAGVVLKQIGGNQPCPPPDCGCDKRNIACTCTLLRKKGEPDFCLCLICPEVTELAPMPEERRGGRRSLVILPVQDTQSVPKLLETALQELRQMGPTTTNLVIKTKSTPP